MKTYANQKVVTIHKAMASKTHTYAIINKECLMHAMSELTLNELKVYLYLASNQNNFKLALSTDDIAKKIHANKRNIQTAVETLIDKRYLLLNNGNQYDFSEQPFNIDDGELAQNTHSDCIKNSYPMSKTLIGSAQNTHSNMSETLIEIIQNNTIDNTSYITEIKEDFLKKLLLTMSCKQLADLQEMYSHGTPYKEIATKYNIPYFDAKHFQEIYNAIYQNQYNQEHQEEAEYERRMKQTLQEQWRQEREEAEMYQNILQKLPKRKPKQLQIEECDYSQFLDDPLDSCKSLQLLAELSGNSPSSDIDSW